MPIHLKPAATPGAPPARQGGIRLRMPEPEQDAPEESSWLKTALIGGGLAGAALLARKPGLLKSAMAGPIGKIANAANVARQQMFLTGYALPKSILGGIGSGVERSIETGSTAPLREMLSMETLKDAGKAFKASSRLGPAGTPTTSKFALPGRAIGAFDTAANNALIRSGATADEASNALLQSPLPKPFAALENPVAQYAHPFRRTPFNQWFTGYDKFQKAYEGDKTAQKGLAIYGGVGAVHGAATADERYPISVPFGVAASARYGVPYGLGALLGRTLAGAKDGGGIADQINPVSAYGVEQGFLDPLRPVTNPPVFKLLGVKK